MCRLLLVFKSVEDYIIIPYDCVLFIFISMTVYNYYNYVGLSD